MNVLKRERGFTIIEVVLVLAIAALIFLIVFLAVPALQRNQRDTQRRSDVGRLVAQTQNYQSNRRGALPLDPTNPPGFAQGVATVFYNNPATVGTVTTATNYFDNFDDPSAGQYRIADTAIGTAPSAARGVISSYRTARCDAAAPQTPVAGGGARSVAYVISLEGADFYCQNN